MAKPLSILFVSSELVPFSKESGVADVAFSLPIALRNAGHDVRVISPKYGCISERKNKIHEISRLRDVEVDFDGITELITIKSSTVTNQKTKVQAYIVTNRHYYDDRKGIFHDPDTWQPYEDNCERFMFYAVAIVKTCLMLGWIPDVIHCHDWQTAFLPGLIREKYASKFKKTRIVFTIHNFYRQGVFDLEKLKKAELPKEALKNYRHKYKFNFMKGAISYADKITTVSPNYAKEILKDREYSDGLNAILKERKNDFVGILNGIDTVRWNPVKDPKLAARFENGIMEYKAANRRAVSELFGLEYNPDVPLLAMIPRIGYQKGVDLFLRAADRILKEDVQMVLLGQGTDEKLKNKLRELAKKYDNFKLIIGFKDEHAHLIEAGADIFIMPSQYEPCGLNAMFSLAYGTVPVVRSTGGLADIVQEFDPETNTGNGFLFSKYDGREFYAALMKAVKLFSKKKVWYQLLTQNMAQDYGWNERADQYYELYKSIKK